MKKIILAASFIFAVSIATETKPIVQEALIGFSFGAVCGFIPPFWPGAAMAILMITDSGTLAAHVAFYAALGGFVLGAIAFCVVSGMVIYYYLKPQKNSTVITNNFTSMESKNYNSLPLPQEKSLSWRQIRQNRLRTQAHAI